MTILGSDKLEGFKQKHPAARNALAKWESVVRAASWKNFVELKATFSTASYVDGRTIFNVGGNKYRVMTVVQYALELVSVTDVETHPDYSRGRWK